MNILQNITMLLDHNSTVVEELENTMKNLSSNAQAEDNELKLQEDELLKLKKEVENYKCDCAYEDWEDWSSCTKSCKNETEPDGTKTRFRGVKWEPRNNGEPCKDDQKKETVDCGLSCCRKFHTKNLKTIFY